MNATVEKNITAYTIEHTNGVNKANGWHFIASPVNESDFTPGNVDNMLCNDYDLYRLNPSTITWENYKNSEHSDFTSLVNGQGYLYANSNDVTLSFTGTIKPYDATYTVGGTGWNLVGNPYTFNAYVNQSHYTLNDTRDAIVAATSNSAEIAPCTGVVVEGNATFHKETVSQSNNNGYIQLAVAQQAVNRGTATTIDNAIVSFNEGNELDKFYFGTPNANIYIPQNGKDYAIVNVGRDGVYTVSTKDVNFKANENGQYTITISPENVEMGYLHLIDNMTGVDVNLLQTPEYTFSAKTMDSESRFKLVFVACNNEDGASSDLETFAFFSNGNWIIANEGQATLQVIDLTGRILSSETVNGCVSKSINVASGIYLFRLVNGNDAKVQKVVVR